MPELPEVETVKKGLVPAMERQRIVEVTLSAQSLRFPYPDGFRQIVQGAVVEKMARRGKYIIASLSTGASLILHLGMSGSFRIIGPSQEMLSQKHDHINFKMEDGTVIIYNDPRRFGFADIVFGDVEIDYKPFAKMGPEPLGESFNASMLKNRLEGLKAPIKAALLNQEIVAGLGNIYVCEALYRSGIDPRRRASQISLRRLERLVDNVKAVLEEAIKSGGSSLKDHKGVDGTMGYFQHHFDVYDREGQICRHAECQKRGTPCIERIVQSGRSTFYCSYTQS